MTNLLVASKHPRVKKQSFRWNLKNLHNLLSILLSQVLKYIRSWYSSFASIFLQGKWSTVKTTILLYKFISRYLHLHFYCSRSNFNLFLLLTIIYKWAIVKNNAKNNACLYVYMPNCSIVSNNLTVLSLKDTRMNTSL